MDRNQVALNIENDRLVAVAATVQRDRVVIRKWLTAARPAEIDLNNAGAVGKWLAGELRSAGMWPAARRGAVVFGVPRGEVVLKRIGFPPGTDDDDLPSMVRLQVVRQLTVSPENAAIDYVPLSPSIGSALPAGKVVLAAALQGDRLAWRRAVCKAAGIRLMRVGLQSAGAAALLAEASQRRTGGTLGIALGRESTEFVIVEDGQLVFARATDLMRPSNAEETETFAQRVAVEAKRTWMSYRVSPDSPPIEAVTVLGFDDLSQLVAARCGETLELPAAATGYPRFVEAPPEMSESDRSAVAPLVGLVAEPVIDRPILDFANARRVPDVAGARRRLVLLSVLGLIVLGGGLYTYARLDLHSREQQLAELKEQWGKQSAEYAELVRSRARVEHIKRFRETGIDWLAHLDMLTSQMPDPREAVLDSISARSETAVVYTMSRESPAYSPAAWSERFEGTMTLAGSMKRRDVADALRARLVDDSRYSVQTRGSDVPDRFDWTLATDERRPEEAKKPTAPAAAASTPAAQSGQPPAAEPKPANRRNGGTGGRR
jgi:Tfp pilus assembly PilM family ATPase